MASAVIGEIIEHAKRKGGVVEVLGSVREPVSEPKEVRKPPPRVQAKAQADIGATRKIPSAKIPAVDPEPEAVAPESQPIRPMAVINVAEVSSPDAVASPLPPDPAFPEPARKDPEQIKTEPIAADAVKDHVAAALDPDALAAAMNTPLPVPSTPLTPPPAPVIASPLPVAGNVEEPAQPMVAAAPTPAPKSRARVFVLLLILIALVVAGAMLLLRK